MNTQKQEGKGRFVQYPLHIIYNCPDLTRDDKWVLLAIMGECWTEGPHKLSYRDISRLSGVPISLLSSIKGKESKPDKEGIIDRLVRMGFIKVTLGKEIKLGKPSGNAQTYIHVNHKRIWEDNVSYCEAKRSSDTRERYRCEEDDFKPVSYTNRLDTEPVRIENNPVSYTNESVPNTNNPVSYTNEPVRDASSKVTPYITDINTTKDKEEGSVAPSVAHPSTFQISLSVSSQEEQSPIAASATRNGQYKPSSKKKEEKAEPVMPPQDAPWPSRETAVQIVEAKKGRIYSDTTRKQELAEAGKLLEINIDGATITREQFESAWDELASSSWWEEHGKPCMIKYLRRDDTIVGILKKLAKKGQARTKTPATQAKQMTTVRVDDEAAKRNFDKMVAAIAAQGAR